MLIEVYLENFLLLKKVHLDLESPFLAFTGETGAGKSMFVTALAVLLGKTSQKDCIGPFGNQTILVGIFQISSPQIRKKLEERGISLEDGSLEVKRILEEGKRSRVYLNGIPSTQKIIKEIGEILLDIHSQNDQRYLLSPRFHLEILDYFLGLQKEVQEYQELYQTYLTLTQKLEEMKEKEKSRINRMEFLEFQMKELEQAKLQPGEKEEIFQKYQRISHGAEMGEKVAFWLDQLIEGEESVSTILGRAQREWRDFKDYEPRFKELSQVMDETEILLGQMGHLLREIQENLVWDPEELQFLEERLAFLERLEQKYHREGDQLLEYFQEIQKEYKELLSLDENREELEQEREKLFHQLMALGKELRQKRIHGAKEFQKLMEKEMGQLGMESARFKVSFDSLLDKPGPFGLDKLEFLVRTNEGLPFGPLGKISSGGELSRIMLTLKGILSEEYQIPTIIFDEIDSGVGGRLGQVLGEKLKKLSQSHQVFMITHLPQLAAMAKKHYKIEKRKHQGMTSAELRLLEGEDRKKEIASMMRGKNMTPSTLKEAEELLKGEEV